MSRRGNGSSIVGVVVVIAILGALAWWFRGDLARLAGRETEPTEVSAAAAASAEIKIQQLQDGSDTVRLSDVEITSLLRFRAPTAVFEILTEPSVAMSGDTLRVSGMVPTDRLPAQSELDRIRALLPDTASLMVSGRLHGLQGNRVAFQIQSVEFAGIPIPERYYPTVLERAGRVDEPGLEPTAFGFQLPPGVGTAAVRDGELVLTPSGR